MRSQLAVPMLCAVLGSGATVVGLLLSGALSPPASRTVIQQGPLLLANPVGGTAAGEVYERDASGVVALRADTLAASPTAFDPRAEGGVVTGAAVVVDASGLLLTAAHLVRAATRVEIDAGGRRARADVVAIDTANDLAVLRVRPAGLGLEALALGDSESVRVGDPVVALGREVGAAPALSAGAIAARQPTVVAAGGSRLHDALQIDAELGPSDVGGPLVDADGRVIGVTTRIRTAAGDTLDLAVPATAVRRVLASAGEATERVVDG